MARDKYDFIQEVLNNDKLNTSQRERILILSSVEIKKDKELGSILEERVIKLEEKVGIYSNVVLPDNSVEDIILNNSKDKELINPSLPKSYSNPLDLFKYLLAYNLDPILKSTCHLIDSDELIKINKYCNTDTYKFDKHYAKIIESFNKINSLRSPAYIKALIRGYLTGKKFSGEDVGKWSHDNIRNYWSDKSIRDWCLENPGVPPNPDIGLSEILENSGFKFANPINTKDEPLKSLGDLVLHFKKMFHIREDNSLLNILQRQNIFRNWNEKIDFRIEKSSFPENIEIFTDVDKLLQSYDNIIQLIIEFKRDEKPLVLLSLRENESSIYLTINFINGVFGKSLPSAKVRLVGQKYAALINKLNGLCNIYLQADFGEKVFSKLTIWDNEWNTQKERIELPCDNEFQGGVEHKLEFKRR